jgi:hypothetical protein
MASRVCRVPLIVPSVTQTRVFTALCHEGELTLAVPLGNKNAKLPLVLHDGTQLRLSRRRRRKVQLALPRFAGRPLDNHIWCRMPLAAQYRPPAEWVLQGFSVITIVSLTDSALRMFRRRFSG